MKVCVLGVVALLGVAPVSAKAMTPQATTTAKSTDKALDERIEKRIHTDATLKKYHVDVMVTDGVATLTGMVPAEADRRKAEQMATVTGIARVDNQIVVDMNVKPKMTVKGTAGTVERKTKEGAEATKDAAVKVGEKTKEGLSKTGEVITDAWVTTRVHSKFITEDLLKDSDIDVDTTNHVVTLSGTVMSAAGRARAAEQAKEVEGVHSVVNHLTIGPKK